MMRSNVLSKLLHTCRELSDMPQQELANELHVDRTLISKIENGKASVSVELMKCWIDVTFEGWKNVLSDRQTLDNIRNAIGGPRLAI